MSFTDKELKLLYNLLINSIENEFKSFEFYKHLSGLTPISSLKQILNRLADEEKKHIDYIKCISKNIFNNTVFKPDALVQHILRLESNFKLVESTQIKNIDQLIKFAIAEENKTIEFYRKLKEKFKGYNAIQEILAELIKNEELHKVTIAEITIEYQEKIQKLKSKKKILVFDLDGTLVNPDYTDENVSAYLRPNTTEFLAGLKQNYILCIFSRSDIDYIYHTVKSCGISEYFDYYFDNSFTLYDKKNLQYIVKRLSLPEYILSKIIVIDDNYTVIPSENLIKIHSYTGDKNDKLFVNGNLVKLIESRFEKLEMELGAV